MMDAVFKNKFAASAGFRLTSFEDICVNEELAKSIYDRWHEVVEHVVPREKLFVVDLKKGSRYAGLAGFLKGKEGDEETTNV